MSLSNEDFKKLINEVAPSQRVPQKVIVPVSTSNSSSRSSKKPVKYNNNNLRPKTASKYRDRAEERRRGIEIKEEEEEGEFEMRTDEASDNRMDVEDEELEKAFAQKAEKIDTEKPSENEDMKKSVPRFKSHVGRNLYRFLQESQIEKNQVAESRVETFLPNRMTFIYSLQTKDKAEIKSEMAQRDSRPGISLQFKTLKPYNVATAAKSSTNLIHSESEGQLNIPTPISTTAYDPNSSECLPRIKLQALNKRQTHQQEEESRKKNFTISEDILQRLSSIIQVLNSDKFGGDFNAYAKRKRKEIKKERKLQELREKEESERQRYEKAKILDNDVDNIFDDANDDYVCVVQPKKKEPKKEQVELKPELERSRPQEQPRPSLLRPEEEELLRKQVEKARQEQIRLEEERKRQKFTKKDYETGYAALFLDPNVKNAPKPSEEKKKKLEDNIYMECYPGMEEPLAIEYDEVEYDSAEDEESNVMRSSTLEAAFKNRAEEKKIERRGRAGHSSRGRGKNVQNIQEKKQKSQKEWQQMQHVLKRKYGDDYIDQIQAGGDDNDDKESKKKKKK